MSLSPKTSYEVIKKTIQQVSLAFNHNLRLVTIRRKRSHYEFGHVIINLRTIDHALAVGVKINIHVDNNYGV